MTTPAPAINIILCVVYRDNHGNETYEPRFVDADGNSGAYLRVTPEGLQVVEELER